MMVALIKFQTFCERVWFVSESRLEAIENENMNTNWGLKIRIYMNGFGVKICPQIDYAIKIFSTFFVNIG